MVVSWQIKNIVLKERKKKNKYDRGKAEDVQNSSNITSRNNRENARKRTPPPRIRYISQPYAKNSRWSGITEYSVKRIKII